MLALLLACNEKVDRPTAADDPWSPSPGTTWQWQLSGTVDRSVDAAVYDVDLVDAAGDIAPLHADGRSVICYFSAGSYEDWRPDAAEFPEGAIGEPLDGWDGEWWLDVRDATVRDLMLARLDRAVDAGCDGVEPDNVDGWANRTGFPLTRGDQLDYDGFLADAARDRGLSVGLKNDAEQVDELVDRFDWALDEECLAYHECDALQPFVGAGKAVLHVEYVDRFSDAEAKADDVCGRVPAGFSTLIKTWDLDARRVACP